MTRARRADPRVVRQNIFTVVTRVCHSRVDALEAYLNELDTAIRAGKQRLFPALEQLHFCSFTVFRDDNFGPYLVFESNVDGSPDEYLTALCAAGAAELHAVLGCCADYTAPDADPARLCNYLRAHAIRPATAFVGSVGRSARRIRDEAALVATINDLFDGLGAADGTAPEAIVEAVRAFVRAQPGTQWVWEPSPRLTAGDLAMRWGALAGAAVCVCALGVLCFVPLLVYLAALYRRETTDPIDIPGPPHDQLRTLTGREDRHVQNHMASLCYVKPGALRRRTLKFVLFAANLVARVSTRGKLLGLDSLHFAHWALIDNDTRLLFLTNYDGSWENYLDDFIDKVAAGLTAIWSNTVNFPRTSFLLLGGARDEKRFKAIARTTQAYTNAWYSAYPMLPVTCIETNRAICEGLAAAPNTLDAAAWLQQF